MAQTATQVLEGSERLVRFQSELSCLQRIQKDNMKEIAEKDVCITKLRANIELLQQEGADTHAQVGTGRVWVSGNAMVEGVFWHCHANEQTDTPALKEDITNVVFMYCI